MLLEKKISTKINYDVLKSLNVESNVSNQQTQRPNVPDDISFVAPKRVEPLNSTPTAAP